MAVPSQIAEFGFVIVPATRADAYTTDVSCPTQPFALLPFTVTIIGVTF